jgi:tetratricopeptide (TPR) repeat protein
MEATPAESPSAKNERIYTYSLLAQDHHRKFDLDGDISHVVDAIHLSREALSIAPEGHPARADCCGILANSLTVLYKRVGEEHLLAEAIDLERHTLLLRSEQDPHRAGAFGNLASCLKMRYERIGDETLLIEAIDLERKALKLRHEHDPDRAGSCVNLAGSLVDLYERIHEDTLLAEAVCLQREALNLWGEGHPHRALLYGSLATSLRMRYELIGDDDLILTAIELERKALALRPVGNPRRVVSCTNLATSLSVQFARRGGDSVLAEAISLRREALALSHEGDPSRVLYYGNLANSLSRRYYYTSDIALLMESIDLDRRTLALCSEEHPLYAGFCGNLASSLKMLYEINSDESLLDEILILGQVAVVDGPPHTVWRSLCQLAWVCLQISSPFYNVNEAISYLSRCLENELDQIPSAATRILVLLDGVWRSPAENKHLELMIVYRRLVNFLPLLAHPALQPTKQLRALSVCRQIGFDAFVNAALAGMWTSAFDVLELAQGVIWSQGLHIRDPQLQAVPEPMRQNLESLLFAIAGRATDDKFYDRQPTNLTSQDVLHDRSSQSLVLIRRIRELPGLEHFMLGETFEALCTAATTHPVVVLVGARNYFYAIIIGSPQAKDHALLSLDLTERDIEGLSSTYIFTTSQRRGAMPDNLEAELARLQLGKSAPLRFGPWYQQMNVLWVKIVKPVLEHLELKVSILEKRK